MSPLVMKDAVSAVLVVDVWNGGARETREIDVESTDQLDEALAQLADGGPYDVHIVRTGGGPTDDFLAAGGENGRFLVIHGEQGGATNHHALTGAPLSPAASAFELHVGGERSAIAPEARLTFEEMRDAARWFVVASGRSPKLSWVEDGRLGDDDLDDDWDDED